MDEATSPPHSIQNPVHGTTINTSPTELGLSQSHVSSAMSDSHDSDEEQGGGGKGIVKRTVEKLGRSTSLSRSKKQGDSASSRGHRSLFSLSRHKGKDKATEEVTGILAGHAAGDGAGVQEESGMLLQ